MKRNILTAFSLLTAALLLSSCSDSSAETPEISETVSETDALPEENEQEVSYMEKYKDIITELAPPDITQKREGMTYPEFVKYTYYSETAERDTPVNVLLPAGYSEDKEYPVLYILHGYYDNEDWMTRDNVGLDIMLTNLCADGEAEEMIAVLPYIYCNKDMPYCTGMNLLNSLNYDNFINDLTGSLMPFIEENFSAAKGRENTAITGFSMGGRESLFIGLSRPEMFGYIGAVCPAPGLTPVEGSPDHPGQLKESELKFTSDTPNVLLISSSDIDGVVGSFPESYRKIFDTNQTEYLSHKMASTGHDNTSVTPHLYNFLRLIFKK